MSRIFFIQIPDYLCWISGVDSIPGRFLITIQLGLVRRSVCPSKCPYIIYVRPKVHQSLICMCSDLPRARMRFRAGIYTIKTVPISREKGSSHYKNRRKCLTFIVYLLSLYRVNDNIELITNYQNKIIHNI